MITININGTQLELPKNFTIRYEFYMPLPDVDNYIQNRTTFIDIPHTPANAETLLFPDWTGLNQKHKFNLFDGLDTYQGLLTPDSVDQYTIKCYLIFNEVDFKKSINTLENTFEVSLNPDRMTATDLGYAAPICHAKDFVENETEYKEYINFFHYGQYRRTHFDFFVPMFYLEKIITDVFKNYNIIGLELLQNTLILNNSALDYVVPEITTFQIPRRIYGFSASQGLDNISHYTVKEDVFNHAVAPIIANTGVAYIYFGKAGTYKFTANVWVETTSDPYYSIGLISIIARKSDTIPVVADGFIGIIEGKNLAELPNNESRFFTISITIEIQSDCFMSVGVYSHQTPSYISGEIIYDYLTTRSVNLLPTTFNYSILSPIAISELLKAIQKMLFIGIVYNPAQKEIQLFPIADILQAKAYNIDHLQSVHTKKRNETTGWKVATESDTTYSIIATNHHISYISSLTGRENDLVYIDRTNRLVRKEFDETVNLFVWKPYANYNELMQVGVKPKEYNRLAKTILLDYYTDEIDQVTNLIVPQIEVKGNIPAFNLKDTNCEITLMLNKKQDYEWGGDTPTARDIRWEAPTGIFQTQAKQYFEYLLSRDEFSVSLHLDTESLNNLKKLFQPQTNTNIRRIYWRGNYYIPTYLTFIISHNGIEQAEIKLR